MGKNFYNRKNPLPITPQEHFVKNVYASLDQETASRLEGLRREEGITPTCKLGCSHCCRYLIMTNIAEAHTLTQYLKREWSEEQRTDLRIRTQQWHDWDKSRPGRYPFPDLPLQSDPSDYKPCCPLLINNTCSAYPVRPVVCRTHFVCSHPLSCAAVNDPESAQAAPVVLTSVLKATDRFSMAIKNRIEMTGLEFSRSIMLLPQWLAFNMGWDFAIAL
jgi:Fe-S-cluster containining protein